jgi:hypothetical protein
MFGPVKMQSVVSRYAKHAISRSHPVPTDIVGIAVITEEVGNINNPTLSQHTRDLRSKTQPVFATWNDREYRLKRDRVRHTIAKR